MRITEVFELGDYGRGHGHSLVMEDTAVTGVVAAVVWAIGVTATGIAAVGRVARTMAMAATGGVAVCAKCLQRKDRSPVAGSRHASDDDAVIAQVATVIRSGVVAIVFTMLIAPLGLVVGSGTAAGSSAVGDGTLVTAAALPDTVVIKNFAFGPASLVVTPGAKITVVNQDRAPHTLTARDKSFDTGTIPGGQRGEFTAPSSPGTYPYICTVHPSMAGTLIVK